MQAPILRPRNTYVRMLSADTALGFRPFMCLQEPSLEKRWLIACMSFHLSLSQCVQDLVLQKICTYPVTASMCVSDTDSVNAKLGDRQTADPREVEGSNSPISVSSARSSGPNQRIQSTAQLLRLLSMPITV